MDEIKVGKISIPIIKGEKGDTGLQGLPGKDGTNGYSPIKGQDYFTNDEIEEIEQEVTSRAILNVENNFSENLKDISYDNQTGILTITRYNDETINIDLPLELIVSSGTYDDITKQIKLVLANGDVLYIPLSDLIDDFYVKEEIDAKVDEINSDITNLKKSDSDLQGIIEELQKSNERLIKDHKPIPFNGVNNHLVDTGDFPMPISINGGIEQDTRSGDNLFNLYDKWNEDTSVTVDSEDWNIIDYDNSSGTSAKYINVFTKPSKELKANTNYNIVIEIESIDTNTTGNFNIISNDSSGYSQFNNAVGSALTQLTKGTYIFANTTREDLTDTNIKYMLRSFLGISAGAYLKIKFRISVVEKSVTSDTFVYEKYGSMPSIAFPSEVKGVSGHYDNEIVNKNLYDYKNPVAVTDGVTVDDEGFITMSFDNSSGTATKYLNYFGKKIKSIKPSTNYRIITEIKNVSGDCTLVLASSSSDSKAQFEWFSYRLADLSNDTVKAGNLKSTDYCNESNASLRTYLYVQAGQKGSITFRVSVLEDLTVTAENFEYTPHQEQNLPLDIPIGQVWYSGKTYKENGKWYRPIEWVKKVLTGSESYVLETSDIYKRFNLGITDIVNIQARNTNVKSNYFKSQIDNGYSVVMAYENRALFYPTSDITTVEEFQALVKEKYDSGSPVYIIYKLANADKEEITDTTLISQLEELQKADSYKEVTNINSYRASEDVAPLVLSGNALMSNDLRMSKLESALLNVSAEV